MAGEVYDAWPGGATYVFQGTITEDATAGTHVCTLTMSPGAGNEMQVSYGEVIVGATATSQVVLVSIDDGTNELTEIINPAAITTSGVRVVFGATGTAISGNQGISSAVPLPFIVSGTMQLILKVTTAAVSVTQTFAVVCRIKGTVPTATLNDTIGTSTNTVNTNRVF